MKTHRFLPALFFALAALPSFAATEWVFIGRGDHNIAFAHLDSDSGALSDFRQVAELPAPSFLALSPNHHFLYAVSEEQSADGSAVSAFAIGSDGVLTFLNRQLTGGHGPCHVSVDPTGRWVFAANYGSGSMAVFPAKPDGSLEPRSDFIQNHGSGPNHQRQEGPHAHCVVTDLPGQHVFDCDLGLDEVLIYNFDPASGVVTPDDPPFYKSQPGSGPRHLTFHPNGRFAYLLCEMASTLTALDYDPSNGHLSPIQTVPLLPTTFTGHSTAAEVAVHPSGKWVYGSNRGDDSIAVFSCDEQTGRLTLLQHVSSGGKTPRHFEIDATGHFLLAASQDSAIVTVFRLDPATGRLEETPNRLELPHPECVLCLAPIP